MRALLRFGIAILLVSCSQRDEVARLRSADHIDAYIVESQQSAVLGRADVAAILDIIDSSRRRWSQYIATTPSSPLYLYFSRGGQRFVTACIDPSGVVLAFDAPKSLAIRADLSAEEYSEILRRVTGAAKA